MEGSPAAPDGETPPAPAEVNIGTAVTVEDSGNYSVIFKTPAWTFAGNLGAPASQLSVQSGSDPLGTYTETVFHYSRAGERDARIRAYDHTPVVVFAETNTSAVMNTRNFPRLTRVPDVPHHVTYGTGDFIEYSMQSFVPDSPFIFFDDSANTFILSGASHFTNVQTTEIPGGGIATGISASIGMLPAGFEQKTILVAASGINHGFEDWGHALLAFSGKTPAANDATIELSRFGYWTDNGAAYYYKTDNGADYQTTLKNVRSYFEEQGGIPLAYLQLDSWWYPKGPTQSSSDVASGEYVYQAARDLFPDGLAAFQRSLGLPLITHSRWIDPSSPYRAQYRMSASISTDPAFWTMTADYLKASGVVTFEQDWLSRNGVPLTNNLIDQDAYLDNMAQAMAGAGINMQYCMPFARHVLQSTKYSNLVTSRVSFDRFGRNRWRFFLYGSRLAAAVGVWPWTDTFMSPERDNLLLATLSAGIVGVGDAIGTSDFASIRRAIRSDGVLIKPDVPILLLDRSIVDEARATAAAAIATTYSQHPGGRVSYVFAFTDSPNAVSSFTPGEIGYTSDVYVYSVNDDAGRIAQPTQSINTTLATMNSTAYYVVAPIGPSRMALLGEQGKIAAAGKQRVATFSDDGALTVTVQFASGEGPITLHGYAPAAPTVVALSGTAGTVRYDARTQRFTVAVTAAGTSATIRLSP
jgi:hypothetical protein